MCITYFLNKNIFLINNKEFLKQVLFIYTNNVVLIVVPLRPGGIIVLSVNELLDVAKNELINLKSGEIFLVRDLFKGYEWNRISRSDRLLLGTLFLNHIKSDDIGVVPIEKTLPGQQRYRISDRQKEDF